MTPRRTPRLAALLALGGLFLLAPQAWSVVCPGYTYTVKPSSYTTIQAAVNTLPPVLPANFCINVDTSPHSEQVTVIGLNTNNHRLFIQLDPGISSVNPSTHTPINPPAFSTAAFVIKVASVSIFGFDIVSTNAVTYGILASSPSVDISSLNLTDFGGMIGYAGVSLSGGKQVLASTISVQNAYGLYLAGSALTVVSSCAIQANSTAFSALYLNNASSNTISGSFISNPQGNGAYLVNDSSQNSITYSTITTNSGGAPSLYIASSSGNTISYNYIYNDGGGPGGRLDANANATKISYTAFMGPGSLSSRLFLNGASSNVVTQSFINGVSINNDSNGNLISYSTMAANGTGSTTWGLSISGSSSNTVSNSFIFNPSADGAFLSGASNNTITLSTITTASTFGKPAVEFSMASSNTISSSFISNPLGQGLYGYGSKYNTITLSTITGGGSSPGSAALWFSQCSSNTISNTYIQGSTGVFLGNVSNGTVLKSNMIVSTQTGGVGLQLDSSGNINLFLSSNTIRGGPGGAAIFLDQGNAGAITLSSNVITGPASGPYHGLDISTQGTGGVFTGLSIASMTFSSLAPGATAINFLSGQFVSTFSNVAFLDPNISVNVNAGALSSDSAIIMADAAGSRTGPRYANDPSGHVYWPGYVGAGLPGGCGAGFNVAKTGGDYATIQSALDHLPRSLDTTACVVIRDTATYAEQVTVQGFTFTDPSYRLKLMADPSFVSSAPVVSPPPSSKAGFAILNDSVTLQGINVVATNPMSYGVQASSAFVTISSVNVDGGANLDTAGIALAGWDTLTGSSVTTLSSHAISISSVGNTVSYSTAQAGNASNYGLYLYQTSSNTISHCYISNLSGVGARLESGSTDVVEFSTISANGPNALEIYDGQSETIRQCLVSNTAASADSAAFLSYSGNTSIIQSTVTCSAGTSSAGVYLNTASSSSIISSYIQAVDGVDIAAGSIRTKVSSSTLVGTGSGLDMKYGNSDLIMAGNTVSGGPSGYAIYIENANTGQVSLSSNVIQNSSYGLEVANGPTAAFAIDSMTFLSMPSGSTAIDFSGSWSNPFVATFTAINFADANIQYNIRTGSLPSGSSISMYGSTGTKAGATYADDTAGYVHWHAAAIETPTSVYFDEISTSAITASAYAPTPAFTGLGGGTAGTNVSMTPGPGYAGWHTNGNSWSTMAARPTATGETAGVIGGKLYGVGWSGSAVVTEVYDPASNSWTTKTPIPTGQSAEGAVLGGTLYIVGGCINADCANWTDKLEAYDAAADAWTAKKPMLTARNGMAVAAINGKLYAAGGRIFPSQTRVATLEAYDPAADAWATKSPMPTAREALAGAVVNDLFYVLGGTPGSGTLDTVQAYDPATDVWSTKASMPTARYIFNAAALGGKIFAVGGSATGNTAVNEEYDPQVNAWATRAPMPTARYGANVAALGGRVYAVGGNAGSAQTVNEAYDPGVGRVFAGLTPNTLYSFKAKARDSSGVETGESLGVSTYTLAAASSPLAGTPLFSAVNAADITVNWSSGTYSGGFNGAGASYLVQASTMPGFVPVIASSFTRNISATLTGLSAGTSHYFRVQAYNSLGVSNFSWFVLGSTLTPAIETPTSVYFDEISTSAITASAYAPSPAFTGLGGGTAGTDVSITPGPGYAGWHTGGDAWTSKTSMPTARSELAAAAVGGRLYEVGGRDFSGNRFSQNEEFDPVANAWATRAAMPTARGQAAAAVFGGVIYVAGGANGGGRLAVNEAYDPVANAWATRSAMPTERGYPGAAVLGGKIYFAGGEVGAGIQTNENLAYDPASDGWSARAPMPTTRFILGLAALRGKLYAVGGSGGGAGQSQNEEYDPAVDAWTTKAPLPATRAAFFAVVIGGKIVVAGGNANGQVISPKPSTLEYDPATDQWTVRAVIPTGRANYGAAAIDGRLYVVGGEQSDNGNLRVATNESYDPGVFAKFAGLTPNTLYTFKAKARDSSGVETGESLGVSTYTLAAASSPLAGTPLFSAVNAADITVNWSSGTYSGGFNGAGASYLVQASTKPGFVPVLASSFTGNVSATLSGLSAGTSHYFRVQAYNSLGVTDYSWFVLGSTATSGPAYSLPADFIASQRSSGTITVSWHANGNPPGTLYGVAIGTDPGSSCMWVGSGTFQDNFNTTGTSLVISEINGLPLQPGTTYIMDICNTSWAIAGSTDACTGMMNVATRETSFAGTESNPPFTACSSQGTYGEALGIDASGNIWMVRANSTSGSLDKYSSAGVFLSSTSLPDATDKGGWSVQFDAAGNAYAVGVASGPLTLGRDVAVYKVAAAGTILLSSRTFDDGFGLDDMVVGSTVDAGGNIIMAGTYATGSASVAALWKYVSATGVISRTASYSGSGNFDAFFDVRFAMSGDLWTMGYSSNPATSGANRLDLALWRYDGAGTSLQAGPFLQHGYLKTADDRNVAAHLGVNGNGIYVAASRLNSQGRMDSAFLKYSLAGVTQVVTGWTIPGSDENPNGLGFDSAGNVWVGGWADVSGNIAAVWKYDQNGNLLRAEQASGHASANDLAIDSSNGVWLADSGGPYLFSSGPNLPGRATGVGTFAGSFGTAGGATYDNDDFDYGNGVAVDTFTVGGPYIYEIIESSQGVVPQAILAKYSFEGILLSSAALGSGWGMDVAVNPNGVYLTVQQPSPVGWAIDRFDKDLVFISSSLYTAAGNYSNKAITLDIHGNVFVTGWFQAVSKKYRVVKYDKDLNYVTSADFADGTNNDMPADVDTCGQGYVYVTGVSLQGGTTRYLTVKWDNNLSPSPILSSVYTTGNPGYDPAHYMMSVAVNKANGDAYVVGTNGHSDSLLAIKYDYNLSQITTATYSSNIYGAGVAFSPAGDVYASGAAYNAATGDDEVIVKFDSNLVFQSTKDYVAAGADEAGRIALDEAGHAYMACGAGDAGAPLETFKARLIRFDSFGGALVGGAIDFTGAFPDALRAASYAGKNEYGAWLAIDTVTVGGPFLYEMFMSTSAGIYSSPQDHYLVKYQAQTGSMLANVLISTTYAQGLAVDRHGSVYAGVSDVVGGGLGRLVKYDSGLNLVQSADVDPAGDILDIMRLASDGDFIYANVNGRDLAVSKLIKYGVNLVAVATATMPSGYHAANAGVAVTPDRSRVYAVTADSFSAGANKKIFKLDSSLASPIEATVTSLFNEEVELAATNDAVYAAEARLVAASTYVYVRKFDASLNYTGVSSTRQVVGPMLALGCQIQAGPDGYVYVSGVGSGADAGKAAVFKLDPNSLTQVSSATFAAGTQELAMGLAVLSSTQVFVAATSFNGTDYDAVVEKMILGTPLVHARGPNEFVITETDDNELDVSVAYGGGKFLTAWQVKQGAHPVDLSGYGMHARLMNPDGSLYGAELLVSSADACGGGSPVVGSNGTNFLTIWNTGGNCNYNARGMVVNSDGSTGSMFTISISTTNDGVIAFDGTNYLYVWVDSRTGDMDIYGQRVAPGGTLVGGEIMISSGPYNQKDPRVAYGGGKYLVTWNDGRRLASGHGEDVFGQFINPDGSLGARMTIDSDDVPSDDPGSVTYDGTNFLVLFPNEDGGYGSGRWNTYGRFVSAAGAVGPRAITITDAGGAGALWDGSKYGVGWSTAAGTANAKAYQRFFDSSGNALSAAEEIAAPVSGKGPYIGGAAFGSGKYLAVIDRQEPGSTDNVSNNDVYGLFLSSANVSGGGSGTWGAAVAVDWAGNVWEVAKLNGLWQLAKFSSGGVFLSSTSLPDAASKGGWGIQFDSSHNAYAVGTASGTSTNGKSAGAVYKVAASGDLVLSYSTTTAEADQSEVEASTQDSSGNIWMTGLKGPDFVTYAGAKLGLWKYAGGLITLTTSYSRYSGGSDAGLGIQVSPTAIWVVGFSSNPASPGSNKVDLALWKFAPAGASLVAGPFTQQGYLQEFGNYGNAATALTSSFIYTAASKLNAQGRFDMAFSQYDLSGSTVLAKGWTGSGYSFIPNAMRSDSSGNLLIAGSQQADAAPQRTLAAWKYGAAGALQSADTVSGVEEGNSLALTPADVAWLAVGYSTAPYQFNAGSASVLPGEEVNWGGGMQFAFSGDFSAAGGANISATPQQNVWGFHVAVDTHSVGGPYTYVAFLSTTASKAAPPWVSGIVKYDVFGVKLASAALTPQASSAGDGFTLDDSGNLYVNEGADHGPWTITKFNPSLQRQLSVSPGIAYDPMRMLASGAYLYVHFDTATIARYDLATLSLGPSLQEPADYVYPCGAPVRDDSGNIYVLVSTQAHVAAAATLLRKFDAGLTTVLASVNVGGLVSATGPLETLAYSNGNIYSVDASTHGDWVAVRQFAASNLAYTGLSSTFTTSGAMGAVSIRAGSDGNLYLAGTVSGAGGGNYLALKFDPALNLMSSATFNGPANGMDSPLGLAVLNSSTVFVTGASSNSVGNFDAVTARLDLSGGSVSPVFSFTGNIFSGGAVVSAPGFNVSGTQVLIDTITSGGTYYHMLFLSTTSPTGSHPNDSHIARYGNTGVFMSSVALAGNSSEHNAFAMDSTGNIYVGDRQDLQPGEKCWISKFSPQLVFVSSRPLSVCGNQMVSDGAYLYGAYASETAPLVKYNTNLVPLSTATYTGLPGGYAGALTVDAQGFLYVVVSTSNEKDAGADRHLLKYSPSFNGVPPSNDTLVTGFATLDPALAALGGSVYLAYMNAAENQLYIRKYDSSLNYTGISSTRTNVGATQPRLRAGPDGYLYAVTTDSSPVTGGPSLLVLKYGQNLVLLGTATFHDSGGGGLAVAGPDSVIAAGGTYGGANNNAALVSLNITASGAGGGTFSGLFSDASGAVFIPVAPFNAGVVVSTATGDVYVAGASSSTGRSLGVLVRYDSLGNKISSTTVSGSASWGGEFNNIALDPGSGNLYLSGYSSTDTPPYSTYFVKKYSPSLQELASRDFSGPGGEHEFRQIVGINGGFVYAAHSFGPPFLLDLYKLNPLDLSVANQTSLSLPSTDISSHSQLGGGAMGFGGGGDVFLALAPGESNEQPNSLAVLRFSSLPVFISSVVPPQSGLSPEGSAGVTADPASGNVYAAYTSGTTGYLAKYNGSLGLVASATPALLPRGMLLLPDGTIGLGGDPNYAMQHFDAYLNPLGGVIQGFPAGSAQSYMGGAAAVSSTTVMLTGRDFDGTDWAWHTVKAQISGGGGIQGTVSYSGTQPGRLCVAISTQSPDIYPSSVTYSSQALAAQGPFSFAGLTPTT